MVPNSGKEWLAERGVRHQAYQKSGATRVQSRLWFNCVYG
jgi:hypothetical protein